MKKKPFRIVAVSAVLLLAIVIAAGVLRSKSKPVEKVLVPVKVAAVQLNSAERGERYSATIIPRTEVELAFRVGGYVDALQQVRGIDGKMRDLQEGDRIRAGAVLARVRQSDYQVKFKEAESQASEAQSSVTVSKAQYQEALSGIASSKAQLSEAEAAYEKARLDFERAQNLFASHSMTKANYDAAKSQFEMATAKVEAGRSQVRMLEAKADSAKSQIDVITAKSTGAQAVVQETAIPLYDTTLKSPLNGVVLEKSIEKGTLVSSGTKAFVVADTSTVKAVFAVADVALPEMKLGRVLSVESETMPGTEFRGQITAVFPAADKQNRSFDVEVTIPNPDYRLRPNMIVSLHVNTREAASAQPVVPLNAVLKAKDNQTGYAIFVVTDEGGRQVARLRDIKLGEAYGNTVAVTAGVKQGELVITTGSTMVLDGVQVKVIP